MFHKEHIPALYHTLRQRGYLTLGTQYLDLFEMEWIPYEQMIDWQYEEDVTQEVLPFAIMGSGDPYFFIENGTAEPYVGRYFHPEDDGEYYAKSFQEALLRNILERTALPCGCPAADEEDRIASAIQLLRRSLREYHQAFADLFPPDHLELIAHLAALPLKLCASGGQCPYLAPLSEAEAEALIQQYLPFEKMDQPVQWFLENRIDPYEGNA